MQYLSTPARVFLFLWDYIPLLVWFGVFGLLGSRISDYVGIPLAVSVLIGLRGIVAGVVLERERERPQDRLRVLPADEIQ